MWQYIWSSLTSTVMGLFCLGIILLVIIFAIALIKAISDSIDKSKPNAPIMSAINTLSKTGICYVYSEEIAHAIQALYTNKTEVGKLFDDDSCWYVKEIKE